MKMRDWGSDFLTMQIERGHAVHGLKQTIELLGIIINASELPQVRREYVSTFTQSLHYSSENLLVDELVDRVSELKLAIKFRYF